HISELEATLYRGFSYLLSPASRSKSGRIIWTNDAIATLAGLWKRLYSPTCIAQFFGLKTTAIAEAARRAGMPDRRGLPIISSSKHRDPFAEPENQTLVGMMVQKLCRLTKKLFFVRPRDTRTVHYSFQGRIALNRRETKMDDWSIGGSVTNTSKDFLTKISFI
ncbi:hypothetical protein JK182_03690, partial [Acetobacter okinawensis]|nr:hypothetical protein [Acetobacter okinawensis]